MSSVLLVAIVDASFFSSKFATRQVAEEDKEDDNVRNRCREHHFR